MAVFDTGKGSFSGKTLILGRLKRISECKGCINIVHFCWPKEEKRKYFPAEFLPSAGATQVEIFG
jgi:hypothetical protein